MVKIAIAGATSELSREIVDHLVATGKHEILGLVRKDPSTLPVLPGVTWVQTSFESKEELVKILRGVETVLSFIAVHLDPGSETQKRVIDACIDAGVKRFAPSEWSTGTKLDTSVETIPWYAGKVEVSQYLANLNKNKKVLEYTRFQPGVFMNYMAHPHRVSKYITTIKNQFDFYDLHAVVVEGSLDKHITLTSVADIAEVVTRAIEYKGEWPVISGMRGDRLTIGELLQLAEKVRGKPFTIEWLKKEDLEAGELKTETYPRLDIPSIPVEQRDVFSKTAAICMQLAFLKEIWTVSDEWNKILPDYKFTKTEDFLRKAYEGK